MALIYEGVCCAICGEEMDVNADMFATSGVFFPPDHPLCGYCDAPMHWECFERWPDRVEFAKGHFQMWVQIEPDNPYWGKAFLSEEVLVTVNPNPDVEAISVHLAETGSDIRVSLDRWNDWINLEDMALLGIQPIEQEALRKVWPSLKKALPNADVLVSQVDWIAKEEALRRDKEQFRQSEEARLRKPKAHNKACRSLLRQGMWCPFCNSEATQYIDRSPEGKSSFLCGQCGQPFGPVEVIVDQLYGGRSSKNARHHFLWLGLSS